MIRIHTSPLLVSIHNLKNVLEAEGIPSEIRGEFRRMAIGELPLNECWVELWVDDSDEEAARRIVAESSNAQTPSWECHGCGELVEGQFGQCWNCQRERPTQTQRQGPQR